MNFELTTSTLRNNRDVDQAAHLRDLVRAGQHTVATTVAVTSGKGGVGKTNVAANVGICLVRRGLKVALVDADLGLPNADVLLGVQPRYNVTHLVARQRALDEVMVTAPGGLNLVAGTCGAGRAADWGEFERRRLVSSMAEAACDVVLFDCGSGVGRGVRGFACAADVILVVTTPEPTALTDAYAVVKTLLNDGCTSSIRLLVNMVDSRTEAKRAFERLRKVVEKFMKHPIADAGYILHDACVESAVRQRVPFVERYPKCSASVCTGAVAARLVNGRVGDRPADGLFRRVVGMFL